MDETVGAGHDAAVGAVGICGRPIPGAIDFAGLNGAIANRGTRQEAVSEGDRVNEWLEGRSNLPIGRSESAIEFALRIIASANQRTNPAAGVIEHYHRPFKIRHGRIAFSVLSRVIIRLQRMMK